MELLHQKNEPSKLAKLKILLENSNTIKNRLTTPELILENNISKDLLLYFSLMEKPINLLFSLDQFIFEFSKKTYQQKKSGEFSQQLKERKKLSFFYGNLTKKQLSNLFKNVTKTKGYFSKNIFSLLESRLDIVLYRSGLVKTINEARQLIKHKKIQINEKFVFSPSRLVHPGDIISINKVNSEFINISTQSSSNKAEKNKKSIYSQFEKHLNSLAFEKKQLKKTQKVAKSINVQKKLPSQLVCKSLTRLFCILIKIRSFWYLKNLEKFHRNSLSVTSNLVNNSFQNSISIKSPNQFENEKKLFLGKWKFFSKKLLKIKGQQSKFYKKNTQQENFWNFVGLQQKKPSFWFLNSKKKAKDLNFSKIKNENFKNNLQNNYLLNNNFYFNKKQKNDSIYQFKELKKTKNQNLEFEKKRILLENYRKTFIFFLKHLTYSSKFTLLLKLTLKKYINLNYSRNLNKYSFKKSKPSLLSKNLSFRVIRPLNLEISYNLLKIVYLYSPQRLNFPFYIDLDLIKRSLR